MSLKNSEVSEIRKACRKTFLANLKNEDVQAGELLETPLFQ